MKFVNTIGLVALLFTFILNANVSSQTEPADRIDTKIVKSVDKGGDRSKVDADITSFGSNSLVTATSYPFSVLAGVALEDMSSGTTQLVAASQDDTASALTNIGFDFWLDGVRFTQFSANANGLMKLGSPVVNNGANGRTNNLATANDLPKIAAYWDDLCTSATGRVHFKVVGSPGSRRLVVEWQNVVTFGTSCTAGALTIGTFQVWLYESEHPTQPGIVQFVYGALGPNSALNGGYSNGIGSSATSFASITTSADTVSYAASANAQINSIAAGKSYLLTPNIPAAPTALNFTAVTPTSQTLNWTDNAANEVGYVIYRSLDGTNFTFLTQQAAGTTSFNDTGLAPTTNYFYRVYAVTEGALSTALAGNNVTAAPGNITSITSGPWSNPATWSGGVPTAGDNVTIATGHTVTIDSSNAFSVTIQTGAVLQFESATARTLSVGDDVTINAGGTFQSSLTGTITTHVLSLGGDLTNNGTLDFSTNADTAAAGITFSAGATNVTFGGTGGTTDVRGITVAKGAQATIVDLTSSNFTVRGVNTDVAGYLTITSGTFRIGGTFTMTNRTFTTAAYTIPTLGGIWLNNPNYTVARTASGTGTNNNGLLRMTQGVYGIGLTGADGMGNSAAGSTFIVEGGTINAIRIDPQSAATFTMTGGTINIGDLAANTRSNFGSFEFFSTASVSAFNGGTINLIQATVAATPVDFRVAGTSTTNATPTVLNVGTGATATNFNFRISGNAPAMVIDNTTNNKTATFLAQTLIRGNITINPGTTFAINGFLVAPTSTVASVNVVNNGTITGSTGSSRLYFLNTGGPAITYSGTGIAGTTAAPLLSVDFDGGATTTSLGGATNNLITARVILFSGSVSGSDNLECGVGGVSICTTQIGNTSAGAATPVGTFLQPITFNLGTGGQVASYLRTTTPYTSGGNEMNPTRTLASMTIDPNTISHVLGGGNATVSGALTLNTGSLVTSSASTLTHNGAATRAGTCTTNCFIDGPLRRDFAVAPSTDYVFHVGEGVYSPVATSSLVVAAPVELSVEAFNQTLAPFPAAQAISRNWNLIRTGAGTLTANVLFTYNEIDDVSGDETDYRLWRRDTGAPTEFCGIACVDETTNVATATGLSSFSRWTIAGAFVPTAANANLAGRIVTADGRGISNARVILSASALGEPRVALTNPFGYYTFGDLPAGQTYVVTVGSKSYTFAVPSRVITLNDSVDNADFIADPQE